MNFETKTFDEQPKADAWARTYGREHCYPHQFWRVERLDNSRDAAYAVAVRSRNTGELNHYATTD